MPLETAWHIVGKSSDYFAINTHFLLDFGDLDKSFSLDNAHASMALRSLNHDFIVHEALILALSFIISEKFFNRVNLEKTEYVIIKTVYFVINTKSYSSLVSLCSCRKRLLSVRNS